MKTYWIIGLMLTVFSTASWGSEVVSDGGELHVIILTNIGNESYDDALTKYKRIITHAGESTSKEDLSKLSWAKVALQMPAEWYASRQAAEIADTVVAYQTVIGGWPKNTKFHAGVNHEEMAKIKRTGIGATIDNGATITEMRYLAKVYAAQRGATYKTAFLKAFNYLLEAQYANGGWPQFYPVRKGRTVAYSGNITFNDNAFVNVMNLLKEIYTDAEVFKPLALDEGIKAQARAAFEKGVACILNTQILVNGERTVWCAQHDATTLKPTKARAYELASFSGGESVRIVQLLMALPNPSDEIIAAVKGAVEWFEEHQIKDTKYKRYRDADGNWKAELTAEKGSAVWARFYDLETGKPFFCDRDGVKKNSMEELGEERRYGYAWYISSPEKVLKSYPKWLDRLQKNQSN